MTYALYIDNKAGIPFMDGKTYCYNIMDATDLEAAIKEADEAWNEGVYLMRIMKKVGKIEKENDIKFETYEAVLCRRSNGWHRNTKENCENTHTAKRYKASFGAWFEAC